MAVRKPLPEPSRRSKSLGADVAYTAEQIQVLEGREHVRRRPSMYIGSTSTTGLHHLVYEVVDNAVDEALAGYCTRIVVTLHEDGSCSVDDNGRGIPVDIHKKEGLSALELVMTRLNAGGKFGGGGYKVSSGLHGVGVSAVNFLSQKLEVWVHLGGKVYHQAYERGVPKAAVKAIGKTDRKGTIVRFWPDPQIFPDVTLDREVIRHRLREMAYLNKRLEIALSEEAPAITSTFYFEGGIVSFVRALNHGKAVVNSMPCYVDREIEGTQVEVALQYNDTFVENVIAFANTIHTIDGGSQEQRPGTAETHARLEHVPRQAGRLLGTRSGVVGALHRRGSVRRWHREGRARPEVPGHPPDARQDSQCREGAPRQGAELRGHPRPHHCDGRGHRRQLQHREDALPPDREHDRRRRRRQSHPHAAAHILLPAFSGGHRPRLPLPGEAAAGQGVEGQAGRVVPVRGRPRAGDEAARQERRGPAHEGTRRDERQ